MILVFGYLVVILVGIAGFVYTHDSKEEFYQEPPAENVIGDAYRYRFIESDYERVERALIKYADDIALAR